MTKSYLSIPGACLCVCFHNKSANARPFSRKQVNELAKVMLKISYLLTQLQIKFTEVPFGVLVDRM